MTERDAATRKRTQEALSERAPRASVAHIASRAGCSDKSAECIDVERALPERAAGTARAPLKRNGRSRLAFAKLLNDALFRRWERGDDACSTRAIAQKCGVNQRTVHEYRHGEKSAPWALAYELPIEIVEEMNEAIISARAGGRTWRWAMALIRRGLDWVEEQGLAPADRHEAIDALSTAQERIAKMIRHLNEGER